jgi:hypothetical protein
MTERESRSGQCARTHSPNNGGSGDQKIQVWPILVGDEEDIDSQGGAARNGRRCWLSLNIKTFLTMCGTGLAAAFLVSPALLLVQGVSVESYVLLSCLMAVASLIAGRDLRRTGHYTESRRESGVPDDTPSGARQAAAQSRPDRRAGDFL